MRALVAGVLAFTVSFGRADGQSGTVVYASGASLDVDVPGEMAEMREVLEARSSTLFLLHFAPARSLMVTGERRSGSRVSSARFRLTNANLDALTRLLEAWVAVEPNGLRQAYVGEDGSTGAKVLGSLVGGRHRVAAVVAPVEWNITEQHAEHLGYLVTRAVGEVGGESVEAWFAPDIPVSAGPALYGGLPGMILVLSLKQEQGRTTYTATEVVLEGVEDGLIRVPEEGEVTSLEEYRSIISDQVMQTIRAFRDVARSIPEGRCTVKLRDDELIFQCREPGERSSR